MSDEIDREILEEFIKETSEELDALDAKFVALEKSPHDADILNAIFRTMHSIKGSSSFFNLNHVRTFAHKLENLLDELRKGKRQVTSPVIDLLLKGKDGLERMLSRLAGGDMSEAYTAEEEKTLSMVEEALATEEKRPSLAQLIHRIDDYRNSMEQDGLTDRQDVAALFETVEELKSILLDPSAAARAGVPKLGEILVEQGVVSDGEVAEALSAQKRLGDILIEKGKATPEAINKAAKTQQEKAAERAAAPEKEEPPSKRTALKKTMRIEEEKIDSFMDLVGELIINSEVFNYLQKKLEMGQDIDKLIMEFKNANLDYNELTLSLQRGLAQVRKVALKGIFQKLPRMVRDLAASIGKQVDLDVAGEDVLIDKSLFEKLESPVNHIIRNSVDHGVETPEERKAAGKNPAGRVSVSAEENAGDLTIRIQDDGKGMDAAKIKAKALEKGLITREEAAAMPDREAHMLIFRPGFSTAVQVTDVSGRGVGMDVVLTAVREAKGKIDIETEPGGGMTLTITMPMSTTLITISGMVVAVGGEQYIIPIECVKESLRPERAQVSSVRKKGELVDIRGQLYPLIRLGDTFGVEAKSQNPWEGVVMVIEKEETRCCLLVDEIVDETQAVLKDLGGLFRDVRGVAGGAILGDGKIGLVLNVEGLVENKRTAVEA